jgi:SAM-dependent methyltransferase
MKSYESVLLGLYAKQVSMKPDRYLHAHSRNLAVIKRQISIFERLQGFFPESGAILDWGCRHAPDACLVRMLHGGGPQLYGCDVDAGGYEAFYKFADLKYTQLTEPYKLPYENDQFDAVIGSGVLEHVPNDSASLMELYRIIKPGGHFIMTMLPNRFSYTEFLNRRLGNPHHLRLYTLNEAKRMFMHHGFFPVADGYHQVFPSLSSLTAGIFDSRIANKLVEMLASSNKIGEQLWPFRYISTNLFVVGRKVAAFHG